MITIGIYPRKSVYRDNSDSVQVQVRLCQDYAHIIYKDQEIEFRVYDQDEGFSGKNTNRPSFQELMKDVKAGRLDVVMVYKLDRISRNVQEFSAMYEIFQQHDVSFVSVKESFDTTTPMGRTVMYILAAFAQLERENTSERVTDNMQALGASGKWTGGKLPSGMVSERRQAGDKEHSYLLVDKSTIWRPKLLYRLILDGYPITRIERYCRDHGITSQTGKFLNTSQIYNIITNPVYCQNSMEAYYYFKDLGCALPDPALFDGTRGLIGYGKTKTGKSSQKKCGTASWSIAVGVHEPVIPACEWIAAQKRLGLNKMFRAQKHEVGLLKGVLKCRCGARMDIRTYMQKGRRFSYYSCTDMSRKGKQYCDSKNVRIETIDCCFVKQLSEIKLNPDILKLKKDPNIHVQGSDDLRSSIRKLQSSIDNLTSALSQAMETAAAGYIIRQISELDQKKQKLESELRAVLLREAETRTAEELEKQTYDNICYLLDNFDDIDYSGKNELVRKTVKSCVLDGESLRITF